MSRGPVDELEAGGFLPRDLVDRMVSTRPGRLAWFIGEFLYSRAGKDALKTPLRVRDPGEVGKGEEVEPERVLRDIQNYLEACALREALGGGR